MNIKDFDFLWVKPKSGAPTVSIAKYGITFNQLSIEMLNSPKFIMLGFDRAKQTLAIKPVTTSEESLEYAYNFNIKKGFARVGCNDFVRMLGQYTGIDFNKSKRYIATETEGYLLVNLKISESIEENKNDSQKEFTEDECQEKA